ncbi:c-type cytochrome [Dyella nitratireducens]|uniref:Cytochrome c n=1 Tax=Dyella nitratireducens TaxID=1849580 RepID=A0ABQ1FSS8_9GAMM|nr:c-type cytochrome [Dyella nitratireducens]GGA26248.1 cytochrome c [Dyella nitratireducens]GLQ43571.1 cytochrome c [Dyella nitratireducens]
MSFRLAGCRPAVVNAVALVLALSTSAVLAQNTKAPAPAQAASAKPAPATSAPAAAVPAAAPHDDNWMMSTKPGDATAGQAKAAACGACHGMDGNSSDAQYPKLAGQHEMYIAHQLHNFKDGERQNAIMLGMATPLSDQDTRDIGAYFASKQPLPGVADQALVEHGQQLYREGDPQRGIPACMACHGMDGRGNPGAMYPQLTSQHAQYIEAKLKDFHDGAVWGHEAHAQIMPTVAKNLDPQDIAALASYIEGLHVTDRSATAKSP